MRQEDVSEQCTKLGFRFRARSFECPSCLYGHVGADVTADKTVVLHGEQDIDNSFAGIVQKRSSVERV